jgi:hypothetical protein
MTGRVTSLDRAKNEFGAYWEDLYRAEQAIHCAYEEKLREALAVWDQYSRTEHRQVQLRATLMKRAKMLTRKAMG